jgi:hypothetical protein
MQKMSPEQKQKIADALNLRKANHPCPRCGNNNFTLLDGYFSQPIQQDLKGIVLGGPSIPSAVVVCNQCGYMSQHALGVLNLLPIKEDGNDK